ncbi:DNA topoisomerase I [Eubacterium minutum ATCC 700079]|nr:DNA topoisomerase I [Eubacterium minutum ATCC 700079]
MATAKKTLVIVESPSKAKTIGKYLGSKYRVVASVGHVRDLPKSKLGIDIDNDFDPQYISIRGKGDLIKELKKEAKKAEKIYLATDPDREGEAISWHLAFLLGIDPADSCRIEFNEITKSKIKEAIKTPRAIDRNLVDAQQARRVLDRLVGYQISPLLWRKVRRGLSAGRVQSAALKIICDREREIKAFVPEEYWTILATFVKNGTFTAKLTHKDGKKVVIKNKEENDAILDELGKNKYIIEDIQNKKRMRKPYAPFTTSSLQQDAANKLNFNTRKTMMIAQQLYEGIDVGKNGTMGLITYLRTDSMRISAEAKGAALSFIENNFGKEYTANNFFGRKNKDIQDAHEAIRPSDVTLVPEDIKSYLSQDQFKLYRLIWIRFVASQMSAAKYDSVQVDVVNGKYNFRAGGSRRTFDGYQKVYGVSDDDRDNMLPHLEKGQEVDLEGIKGEQNFTQPPARFTEASLVKELEERNIGRPSTYAPIVGTLTDRKYVKREKKTLLPTELGFHVIGLLEEYFKDIVDAGFTASMEDKLDGVEAEGAEWKNIIREFYDPFRKDLEKADAAIEKVRIEDKPTGEMCELCGKPMVIKAGRYGDFIACSGYPECKNTKPIVKTIGVKCPKCGKDIVKKKSKRGRVFYGCSGYPNCDMSYWYKPVNKTCPVCGALLVEKKTKDGKHLVCSESECGYKE